MKRVLALSLLLVMVLSAGALAADPEKPVKGYYDIGSLQDEDDNIGFEFPFTVTIDKYARVWLVENKLFKNPLMGAAGLYTSDEWQVIRDAQAYFAAKLGETYWPGREVDWVGKGDKDSEAPEFDRDGGALFRVESNCDAIVEVAFDWGENPLTSELVLWVYRHQDVAPYIGWPPVNGDVALSRISSEDRDDERIVSFEHLFENQLPAKQGEDTKYMFSEYKIGGAVFIDYIAQQLADTYDGLITITVSAK